MGGFGSGNWCRLNTRRTVEESLTLAMHQFRGRVYEHSSGTLHWSWTDGRSASVGFRVDWDSEPIVTLHYRWRDRGDVEVPIRLQTTPMHFGGERSWFTCPLILRGVACKRRVSKLYLPSGAKYFGCRQCHELTYRSCQTAHQMERLSASIGRMAERLTYAGRLGLRC